MKKIYLTKSHLKSEVVRQLLAEQGSSFLMDIEIKDLESWINEIVSFPTFFDQLNAIKDKSYSLFPNIHKDNACFKELINYKKLFNQFSVDYNTLPIDRDIKAILNDLKEYDYRPLYDFISSNSFDNFTICENNYSLFEQQIIQLLKSAGAKSYKFKLSENPELYRVNCLNQSNEIETLIQYILNREIDIDDTVIYYCNPANIHLLESALNRYGIPYNNSEDHPMNPIANKFAALMNYYDHPDIDNYQQIIFNNTFADGNKAIHDYLASHLDKENYLSPLEDLSDINDYFAQLYTKASEVQDLTYPKVSELLSKKDYLERITYCYDAVNDESVNAFTLKSYLEENSETLLEENEELLLSAIHSLKGEKSQTNGILLCPISEDHYCYSNNFVLDATSKDFFKMETFSGIISENDLADSNYPSIEARYDQAIRNLQFLNHQALTIYFSPASLLDGKACETSSLIETEQILPLQLDCIEIDSNYQSCHQLAHPETVNSSLLKEGILYGSVSSFERYSNCPYSYFLQAVLKLYDPDDKQIDAALTGTLMHAVFEQLIAKSKDQYVNAEKDDITAILSQQMADLYRIYPSQRKQLDIIKGIFADSLMLEFKFLSQFQKQTAFQPVDAEKKFAYDIVPGKVTLRGSIDRIDEKGDMFRILDYKTSKHSIDLKKVQCGLQLQLPTYCYINSKISGKAPEGFYYLNINHPRANNCSFGYLKSKGFKTMEVDPVNSFIKSHQLNGTMIIKSEDPNLPAEFIKSSDGDFTNYYLEPFLQQIYEYFYDHITSGDFRDIPAENGSGCTFCSYHSICHHLKTALTQRDTIVPLNKEED